MRKIFALTVILSVCLIPASNASYLRLYGLAGGISGIVGDDSDFDSLNIAKVAGISGIKYLGDYSYASEDELITDSTGYESDEKNPSFSFSNLLVFPVSDSFKMGLAVSPSNDFYEDTNYSGGSKTSDTRNNTVSGTYGIIMGFLPHPSARLGLAVESLQTVADDKSEWYSPGNEESFSSADTWAGAVLGFELDLVNDLTLGTEITARSGNGEDEYKSTFSTPYTESYRENAYFAMNFLSEKVISEATTFRFLAGYSNRARPSIVEQSGSELDFSEHLNSDQITMGFEVKPSEDSTLAIGATSIGSNFLSKGEPNYEYFYRERETYFVAGLESPVMGLENLLLRGCGFFRLYDAADSAGFSYGVSTLRLYYAAGLGYRISDGVLLDVAYSPFDSISPFDVSNSYSYVSDPSGPIEMEMRVVEPKLMLGLTIDT